MLGLGFDLESDIEQKSLDLSEQIRGKRSYLSGHAAEAAVARVYQGRGYEWLEARWRGQSGEIDLIFRDGGTYIFVEVKQARTFEIAARRLSEAQWHRIHGAASEYLENTPEGQLSDVRLDLALCDGQGNVQIWDGALSHF